MLKIQKKLLLILMITTTAATITACGIKPKHLDAPDAAQEDQFPHTYPTSPSQSK